MGTPLTYSVHFPPFFRSESYSLTRESKWDLFAWEYLQSYKWFCINDWKSSKSFMVKGFFYQIPAQVN